jgi:acetolactate synthase-1/2/3 large subunit
MDINELASTIKEAFHVARSGRPGPVLIDIPKDIQNKSIDYSYPEDLVELLGEVKSQGANEEQVKSFAEMLKASKRPFILAGHGVIMSEATSNLMKMSEKAQIPIGTTLLGIGGVPKSNPLVVGWMGMHGDSWVNQAIQKADLLIACGMRFDDRVTGNLKTYSPNSKKIHIEIDPSEINKNVRVDLPILGDLNEVLYQVLPHLDSEDHSPWFDQINEWKSESTSRDIIHQNTDTLMGAHVLRKIWEGTKGDALIVTDVGQHQMLEAQYYEHNDPRTLLTSGGLGTMGFSLPAGIGASFHEKEREVWIIVGDGSFQMTMTELGTAVQENRNINIAIINNGYLGLVRQWQEMFYDARYSETPIISPDYIKLADAYGIKAFRVKKLKDVLPTMRKVQEQKGPSLIEFVVEKQDMVYPMVPTGADLHEMIERPASTNNLKKTIREEESLV